MRMYAGSVYLTAGSVIPHACLCAHENVMLLTGYLTASDGIDRNHRLKIIQRTFQHVGLPLSTMTGRNITEDCICVCASVCMTVLYAENLLFFEGINYKLLHYTDIKNN